MFDFVLKHSVILGESIRDEIVFTSVIIVSLVLQFQLKTIILFEKVIKARASSTGNHNDLNLYQRCSF